MTDPIEDKLLDNRRIEGDCWIWTGGVFNNGYGAIWFKGRNRGVHIIAAILYMDYELPAHWDPLYQVNHKCNNRLCFNPEHLYIGTQSQNNSDIAKHRGNVCKYGHVGEMNTNSFGCRYCKACNRIREQARRDKKK